MSYSSSTAHSQRLICFAKGSQKLQGWPPWRHSHECMSMLLKLEGSTTGFGEAKQEPHKTALTVSLHHLSCPSSSVSSPRGTAFRPSHKPHLAVSRPVSAQAGQSQWSRHASSGLASTRVSSQHKCSLCYCSPGVGLRSAVLIAWACACSATPALGDFFSLAGQLYCAQVGPESIVQ